MRLRRQSTGKGFGTSLAGCLHCDVSMLLGQLVAANPLRTLRAPATNSAARCGEKTGCAHGGAVGNDAALVLAHSGRTCR